MGDKAHTPLAGEHLRPLGQLSAQGANNITNQKKEKLFFDGFCAINNHLIVEGTENRWTGKNVRQWFENCGENML